MSACSGLMYSGVPSNWLSSVKRVCSVNGAAIAFLVISYLRRNRELRNVALLITLAGAGKVFLYDLVGVEGVARVLSVFSFGFVAATASYVLGRWQSAGGTSGGAGRAVEKSGR